jgi:NDP-sugar pyrophosphorylase family protein
VKIVQSQEEEPLGTAGPIKLARDLILGERPEILPKDDCPYFFVFNSDVICEYPLSKMLEYHKSHGKLVTMLTTQVEDPSKYGVVVPAYNPRHGAHSHSMPGGASSSEAASLVEECGGRVAKF